MHLLLISDSYPNAYLEGQGSFVCDQAQALVNDQVRVGVIACIPVSWRDLLKKGLKYLRYTKQQEHGVWLFQRCYAQLPRIYRYPIFRNVWSGKAMLRDYIRLHGKPDVIHVHGFHNARLARWAKHTLRIPLVITEHNSRFLSGTLDSARLKEAVSMYKLADARIAVSTSLKEKLEQLSGCTFEVVPNAVNTQLFALGTPDAGCVFFSAGNFTANKNQLLQIQAFQYAMQENSDAQLWLAGDGAYLDTCKSFTQDNGLESRVHFLGRLSRTELANRMSKCRVFLISSQYETFGVVAIEAMASGLHVISTRCGGPEDILTVHGAFADNSIEAYAEAMQHAYLKHQAYPTAVIRDYAVNHFSFAAVASRLRQLYSRVLQKA